MKMTRFLILFMIASGFFLPFIKAQDCHFNPISPAQDDSLVLERVISQGIISPEEARKRMASHKNRLQVRSRDIKVLIVTQRFTSNILKLDIAATIITGCAGFPNCQIKYTQVNATPLAFVWSNQTSSAQQSWLDLGAAALNQNWYAQADIVVGFTDDAFTDYGGYGTIDADCKPTYNQGRLVIRSNRTNALFAHELGHTLGMIHDDAPVTITNSVMLPTVPSNPTTMSEKNRLCYLNNVQNACNATATTENEEKMVMISPNPVKNLLQIFIPDAVKKEVVNVCNILGENVLNTVLENGRASIDFSDFQAGLYVLRVKIVDKMYVKKVVKN
jgi:Secretion system C-terminal sorting domain/Metallo-peptidase family M12B Reprolysin-like